MELDLCQMGDQSQINRIAAMLVMRAQIQPTQVLGGTLSFSAPQFVRATCPNLTVEFNIPFTFANFITLSGTARLSARAMVRIPVMNGGRQVLCLRNFQLLGLSIPSAPGFESLAMGAVAQLLPPELCVDVSGLL